MKRSLLLLATTLAFHASALAQTKVPSLINYQGYVATSAGVPIGNGAPENRTVTFRFWKSASDTDAASRLYSESQTVTVLNGDFSVLIGNGAAVVGETNTAATVAEVFASKDVFLGITVDDGNPASTDAEISPRQQLVSTAFAFRASVAESVDNGAITNAMLNANAVNTDQLVASSVTNDKIAASSVTDAKIVDGTISSAKIALDTITAADIAASAVGTSELAGNSVTSAKIALDTITAADIAASAVDTSELANNSVTSAKIAVDTITAADIKAGAVGTSELADNSVSSTDILTDTIKAVDIAPNGVGTSELANGSVTSAKLGVGTMQSLESLRIIRGVVAADGSVTSGVGFTVTKTGTGTYLLNFTPDFASTPTLAIPSAATGLPSFVFSPVCSLVSPDSSTKGRVKVETKLYTGSSYPATDLGFCFSAIGPR